MQFHLEEPCCTTVIQHKRFDSQTLSFQLLRNVHGCRCTFPLRLPDRAGCCTLHVSRHLSERERVPLIQGRMRHVLLLVPRQQLHRCEVWVPKRSAHVEMRHGSLKNRCACKISNQSQQKLCFKCFSAIQRVLEIRQEAHSKVIVGRLVNTYRHSCSYVRHSKLL